MLPFLKPKTVAGLIMTKRKPDGGQEVPENESTPDDSLAACCEDLIQAFHAKDAKSVASALRAAFAVLESEPHEEGSFDEQNEAAADYSKE